MFAVGVVQVRHGTDDGVLESLGAHGNLFPGSKALPDARPAIQKLSAQYVTVMYVWTRNVQFFTERYRRMSAVELEQDKPKLRTSVEAE